MNNMTTIFYCLFFFLLMIMLLYVIYKIKLKFKYRIIEYSFPTAPTIYFAQYKILGVWMFIGTNKNYLTHLSNATYCESYLEALNKISKHKKNMERANEWADYIKTINNIK